MTPNKKHRIFFFTGLGADERAFAFLKLKTGYQQIHVAWIEPGKKESLPDYCRRLVEKYDIRDNDILVGLSFGGLVAVEINRIVKPSLTILISSASTRDELPALYRIAGKTGLYHLIPKSVLGKPGRLKYYLFSLKKPEQRKLFDEIVRGSDTDFVQWAIRQVVCWNNEVRPPRLFKLHGTADRIMPLHKPSTDFIIPGGSHFLTWENAAEVSDIMDRLLQKAI